MRRPVTPDEMVSLALGLQRAWAGALVPLEDFRSLHSRFRARSQDGVVWTVGWRNLRWHRWEQGRWVAATPPQGLDMEAKLLSRLQDLAARGGAAPAARQSLAPQAAMALAETMAAAQARGVDVAWLHGHFRLRAATGEVWTVGLKDRRWYRLQEGRWLGGRPPAVLHLDGIVLAAVQRLQPPTAATPPARLCPSCGASVKPGRKFCGACGGAVSEPPVGAVPPAVGAGAAPVGAGAAGGGAAPVGAGAAPVGAGAAFAGATPVGAGAAPVGGSVAGAGAAPVGAGAAPVGAGAAGAGATPAGAGVAGAGATPVGAGAAFAGATPFGAGAAGAGAAPVGGSVAAVGGAAAAVGGSVGPVGGSVGPVGGGAPPRTPEERALDAALTGAPPTACYACGSPVRPDRPFCVRCGTRVQIPAAAGPALCADPACRRPLKPGKKFCVHCGKPV